MQVQRCAPGLHWTARQNIEFQSQQCAGPRCRYVGASLCHPATNCRDRKVLGSGRATPALMGFIPMPCHIRFWPALKSDMGQVKRGFCLNPKALDELARPKFPCNTPTRRRLSDVSAKRVIAFLLTGVAIASARQPSNVLHKAKPQTALLR